MGVAAVSKDNWQHHMRRTGARDEIRITRIRRLQVVIVAAEGHHIHRKVLGHLRTISGVIVAQPFGPRVYITLDFLDPESATPSGKSKRIHNQSGFLPAYLLNGLGG